MNGDIVPHMAKYTHSGNTLKYPEKKEGEKKHSNAPLTVHPLHCTALHCTALHCTALHCTALHCTALHCTALHCTALHCTALHCTALHCTALHCTTKGLCSAQELPSQGFHDTITVCYWLSEPCHPIASLLLPKMPRAGHRLGGFLLPRTL